MARDPENQVTISFTQIVLGFSPYFPKRLRTAYEVTEARCGEKYACRGIVVGEAGLYGFITFIGARSGGEEDERKTETLKANTAPFSLWVQP